ncbi:MAG: FAD:protein FMN transferase [Bradymonadia bacterium]
MRRALLLLATLCLALPARANPPTPAPIPLERREHDAMGTVFTLTVADALPPEVIDVAAAEAFAEIDRIEALISEWQPTSEISRVNAAAGKGPVVVSAETFECVSRGLEVSRATGGAFDLTWAAFRGVWKFGPDAPKGLPDKGVIEAARARVGWRQVRLDPRSRSIELKKPGMALGMGGIGQGYGVAKASEKLRARGFRRFILDGGGDLYLEGEKAPGVPWTVGVQHPRDRGRLTAEVRAANQSIITSGDYERFFELDGRRYHHIIDLRTGYPAQKSVSATVFATDPTLADAFATGCFVLGPKDCLRAARKLKGVEAAVFAPDGRIHASPGVRDRFPARWNTPAAP